MKLKLKICQHNKYAVNFYELEKFGIVVIKRLILYRHRTFIFSSLIRSAEILSVRLTNA